MKIRPAELADAEGIAFVKSLKPVSGLSTPEIPSMSHQIKTFISITYL